MCYLVKPEVDHLVYQLDSGFSGSFGGVSRHSVDRLHARPTPFHIDHRKSLIILISGHLYTPAVSLDKPKDT